MIPPLHPSLVSHADALALELRPEEPLAVTSGHPRASGLELYHDDVVQCGVWEVTPGEFAGENTSFSEHMHVLCGEATVTSEDGTTIQLRPGSHSSLARDGAGAGKSARRYASSTSSGRSHNGRGRIGNHLTRRLALVRWGATAREARATKAHATGREAAMPTAQQPDREHCWQVGAASAAVRHTICDDGPPLIPRAPVAPPCAELDTRVERRETRVAEGHMFSEGTTT